MKMKQADMIVHTHHMYTMEGDGVGYHLDDSVAIVNGKIAKIAPRDEIEREFTAVETLDATAHLVLPGLIDGHMHSTNCAMRGIAQDVGNWMMHGAGPFQTNATSATRRAGSKLAIAEAVMNGTTTIGEEGFALDSPCEFIQKVGVRGNVGVRIRSALNRVYAPGELYEYDEKYTEETFSAAKNVFNQWHGADNGRIRVMFAPQGADFVSEEVLHEALDLAHRHNTLMYLHLSQGSRETKQMMMRYGSRTIPWMIERNLIDDHVVGIHLTDALPEEVQQMVGHGGRMVLCSAAIGLIDGIQPPAKLFQDAGGMVGLGTDQANGNNEHSIFNEMRMTALFNKLKYEDPEVMPCWKVLRMATIEGARAIGIDDAVGSLEAGKDADLILLKLDTPAMRPIYTKPMRNLVPNAVYAACGRDVDTVISGGRVIVKDRKPQTFDLEEILAEVQEEADRLAGKAEKQFWEIRGANALYMEENKL